MRPRSKAVSRAFVQELQEVEIPTGHPVGRGAGGRPRSGKGQVQISELFVDEKCNPAVLNFPRSTGVGRIVPRGGGDDREED